MKHNYISDQVIRYIYLELPALEYLETEHAIENDPAYAEAYRRLSKVVAFLPAVSFYPSKKSITSILSYSKQTA